MPPVNAVEIATIAWALMDKSRAFTMIELLVVVTILMVFFGLSIAYYGSFNEQKKLERDTNKLIDVLSLAQKKAGVGDLGTNNCLNFSGYTVSFTSGSYMMTLSCSPSCSETGCSNTFNLQPGISLSSTAGSVTFKKLSTGIDLPEIALTVTNTSTNRCKKITISGTGLISENPACP